MNTPPSVQIINEAASGQCHTKEHPLGRIRLLLLFVVCFCAMMFACISTARAEVAPPVYGVNLAGAESGPSVPGTINVDYTYPTAAEINYYKSKNFTVIRFPVRWERIQRSLNAIIDPTEMGRVDGVIAAARTAGMKVILDLHNYNVYKISGTNYQVGSTQVPYSALNNVWGQLATHYASETAIYGYDLMNEPSGTVTNWQTAAQGAVDTIRTHDTTHWVIVEGVNNAKSQAWAISNPTLSVTDSAGRLIYSAHSYWDANNDGTYGSYTTEGGTPTRGIDAIKPFTDWITAHGYNGYIGEFGVPYNTDSASWNVTLDNFLASLETNGMSATYWAGGPWWSDTYALGCEPHPLTNPDKPQMAILQKHIGPVRYEAETVATAVSSDAVTLFTDPLLSSGTAEKLNSNAVNDYITYTLPVLLSGTYQVKMGCRRFSWYGQFQLAIDGTNQGAVQDEYGPTDYPVFDFGTKAFPTAGNKAFNFTVTGKNASSTGYSLTFDYFSLTPVYPQPVEVILDNTAASGITITGSWSSNTSTQGYYGTNYLSDLNAGQGTKSVRFTPNLPSAGSYLVCGWWCSGSNRASNVPIDIISNSGTTTVIANQTIPGSTWVPLGTFNFNAGTGGSVLIRTTGANNYVMADAIRFVKQ